MRSLVANDLRGVFPPVLLRAVCLVRAISSVKQVGIYEFQLNQSGRFLAHLSDRIYPPP